MNSSSLTNTLQIHNNMHPRFEHLTEKMLIGKKLQISLADNKTFDLWRSFMPRRKEIKNNLNTDLISMQVYDESYDFNNFDPFAMLEKWATIEVSDFNDVPSGMETLILPEGLYAVFLHYGPASEAERTFRYIFQEWLPKSGFQLDNRPHFEILGDKYRKDDPHSEEEVWIPVYKPQN